MATLNPIVRSITGAALIAGLMSSTPAMADSGAYIGGSVGDATVQIDVPDEDDIGNVFEFDESDFAWKAFGGYNFDLALFDLAIEGGYVDLGKPSGDVLGTQVEVDVSGWDLFALAGVQLGPIGAFAKAGVISWDAEATVEAIDAGEDDGTDPAYGIGAHFSIGSLQIRAEYEFFDIDTAEDVYMLSAGLVFGF